MKETDLSAKKKSPLTTKLPHITNDTPSTQMESPTAKEDTLTGKNEMPAANEMADLSAHTPIVSPGQRKSTIKASIMRFISTHYNNYADLLWNAN